MAKQTLNDLVPYLEQRTKINENFTELYDFETNTIQDFSVKNIYVDVDGSDITGDGRVNNPYQTIKFALSQITDNSSSIRYTILVGPGIYVEANPIQLKSYVNLISIGGSIVTRIEAQNNSLELFLDNVSVEIQGFTLKVANSRIVTLTGFSPTIFREVAFLDCLEGVLINDSTSTVQFFDLAINNPTITSNYSIKVSAGLVNIRNLTIISTSTIVSPILIDGINASANVINYLSSSPNITNGLYALNGGVISFVGIGITNSTYGLRLDSNSFIQGNGFAISSSDAFDIIQEDALSTISLSGGTIDANKLSVQNWANVQVLLASTTEGDIANLSTRELHVGTMELGRETCLGEGDSTARGMRVYSYDGAAFTNVTSEASSASGSTFTFPTTVNSGMYISTNLIDATTSDLKKFYGIKLSIDSALDIGTGSYVWEYWNGTSWVEFKTMTTDSDPPYLSYANSIDGLSGSYQTRFDVELSGVNPPFTVNGPWVKNDPIPLAQDQYWVRLRITNPITTSPVFQQIKVHSNRVEANADGWTEYFGTSRPTSVLNLDFGLSTPTTLSQQDPANDILFLSDNNFLTREGNGFRNDRIDLTSFNSTLPSDIDTSVTILFIITYIVDTATAGNIEWQLNYSTSKLNDDIFLSSESAPTVGPNEKEITILDTVDLNSELKQRSVAFELEIADAIAWDSQGRSDLLWITLRRNGLSDSYGGKVSIINTLARYVKWNNGSRFIDR